MIQLDNVIKTGDAYDQADAALCAWEYALDALHEDDHDAPYCWLAGREAEAAARNACIDIAHLIEIAYRVGNGETGPGEPHRKLTSYPYDWEVVPAIMDEFMKMADSPGEITTDMAATLGERLPEIMAKREGR